MPKTIKEMIDARANAWDEARNFLDSKQRHDGTLAEEDAKTYAEIESRISSLTDAIERAGRFAELEAAMNRPTSSPILTMPSAGDATEKTGTASDSYNMAFWNYIRDKNWHDIRNDLQVGTNTEGGYLVPDEFERKLIEKLEEQNFFRGLATIIKTSSGDRKIPVVTEKGTAVWMDEEEQFTLSDDTFGQTSLSAYKLGTSLKISDELLHDSAFNMEAYISKEFARRMGAREEEAFLIGDGVGKPTGIFAATGGAPTGATTAGANITFDDVMDLFYALESPYRKNATWIMNEAIIKNLRKIKDTTGNYIWSPSVVAGQPDRILNLPYHTSTFAPSATTSGSKVLALGDFSYYWIGDRQGVVFKRLNELFAMTGQVGFLAYKRVDGKLMLPDAVKVLAMK